MLTIQEHERYGEREADVLPMPVKRDIAAQFIPLALPQQQVPAPQTPACEEIVIELQHNGLKASIRWPVSQAQQCAAWLREVMR
ncbi:transposase [Pusillimonas sp. T7-7]|uniref:hypothetical protein n=1 Tax=Pusillimonas sp. (strain T7-7) TaxID=1007105 RepID=UPI0002084CF2|nr:hypothetical protein [Pusillimonas sp. T7-7]AEC21718.1 transposase [Pusillimonas sp. T7-7]